MSEYHNNNARVRPSNQKDPRIKMSEHHKGPRAVIKIEKLNKEFGKGEAKTQVLSDINLEIQAGEYVMFFGPSGCGKSTLLNCIAGLEKPTSGKVILRGSDLAKMKQKQLAEIRNKKIGMIFQQFNVIKSFNVLQNIALPQLLGGLSRKKRMHRAMHLLRMFNLEKFARHIPTELSGGQQQRVAIARALINNPWILIVDEPTGSLDSKAASEVMELIEKLNKKSKRTVLLVTHNADYLKFADTIYHIQDGVIKDVERKRHISSSFDEKEHEEIKLD